MFPEEVYYFYTITCLTSTFSGVILGGILFGYLGGYSSPKTFAFTVIVAFFGVLSAIPVPLSDNKWGVFIGVWFLLFFGSALLPTMTGIMIKSVAESHRTTANSLAQISYNLFGYLPAPFLYGYISS